MPVQLSIRPASNLSESPFSHSGFSYHKIDLLPVRMHPRDHGRLASAFFRSNEM